MATLRDLRNAPQALDEIEAAGSEAAGFTAKQTTRLAKAERLETDNGPARLRVAKRADKATTIRADAGRLAKRAADASNEAHRLALKLAPRRWSMRRRAWSSVAISRGTTGSTRPNPSSRPGTRPARCGTGRRGFSRPGGTRLGTGRRTSGHPDGVSSKSRATRR
ncbi:hypothetical protein [Acidiphilium sp. C61]|uniref:hypothetical protein n=1 Tax=Acidiphilium sp. C61 TaxID=1671485 RepID=UPI00157A313D|nr:hypothetical protein [Acidiphilium sp. C61]